MIALWYLDWSLTYTACMAILVAGVCGAVRGKSDCAACFEGCCDESCMEPLYKGIYYSSNYFINWVRSTIMEVKLLVSQDDVRT